MNRPRRSSASGAVVHVARATIVVALVAVLAACGGVGRRPVVEREPGVGSASPGVAIAPPPAPAAPRAGGGGYYKDDGPGENPPDVAVLAAVPEPEPRIEPLHRFANNPYNVFGVDYVPMKLATPFRQRGLGSWYGRKFHGQRTSSGEPYDMYGMTAAHPTLPIPSYVRVTNIGNGRSVMVRINDRGPFHPGRIIDLSYTAAWKLGYLNAGSTPVEVELVTPDQYAGIVAARRGTMTAEGAQTASASQTAARPPAPGAAQPAQTTVPASSVSRPEPIPPSQAARVAALSEAAPPKAAPLPVDVEPGGVFLQLGAFSGRDSAENFRARVYRDLSWLNDAIEIHRKEGLFRLHLGPYRDRTEAGGMAERIRAALELKPVIVVR